MVKIHRDPATPHIRSLELKFESDPANLAAARKAIEGFAANCGFDQKTSCDLGLCVNEALANIIRHAYQGRTDRPIVLRAECHDNALTVNIRDWGNGVDPSTLVQKPYDPMTPGGVGLICLAILLDDLAYTPQDGGGMLTTMVKRKC